MAPFAFHDPEGEKGIEKLGHRGYVGGMWEEIGQLQFDFLLSKGLKPNSVLLDIACGSLRLGVKAIPFLNPSNYLGIEKERGLLEAGLNQELDPVLREEKLPLLIASDSFEFEKFEKQADFIIAQSLFSHLPPSMINLCFKRLHPCIGDHSVFYATYFKSERKVRNPNRSHDHGYFAYTKAEILGFGQENGFIANYIGDWNHPRGQVIVEYKKR